LLVVGGKVENTFCMCGKDSLLKIPGGHPSGNQQRRPLRTLSAFPQLGALTAPHQATI